MKTILITGGAGFFGELLKFRLLELGHTCVSIDLKPDATQHPKLQAIQGDIRDTTTLKKIFAAHRFDAVMHCAAVLAHSLKDTRLLWTSNVDGTRNIADFAARNKVPNVVFTSSNCLWGESLHRPVTEDDVPAPIELYGRSKWEGEKIIAEYADRFNAVTIRCPTIMDCGRLGLLSILFEFIDEGRKVWVVGKGSNRYQFIFAQDLIDACIRAMDYPKSNVFGIGSDNVTTMAEVFSYVIDRANTGARLAHLPKGPTLFLMKLAHWLHVSPLGPYHYKMIAEDFTFDTTRIKRELGWQPTLTNGEMLFRAYNYYHANLEEIRSRSDVSPHKQPAKMGVIKILKWMS